MLMLRLPCLKGRACRPAISRDSDIYLTKSLIACRLSV
jgi:hypothetical protein